MSDPAKTVDLPADLIQDFYEFWRKARCPKCKTVNWIYDSHSLRSYPDIHNGVRCHKCAHCFWVGDKEELLVRHGETGDFVCLPGQAEPI